MNSKKPERGFVASRIDHFSLSNRERQVLDLCYGIRRLHVNGPCSDPLTPEEVGSVIGRTPERVGEIRDKALKKIGWEE